ncbi:MAG: glycosyltransferase family 39 protein [Pseudomonadota bacterium]
MSDATRGISGTSRVYVLIGLVLLCFVLVINDSWKASPDSALYLELGESLAHGNGYKFNGEQHTYVPPGYPLFVAMIARFFGSDFLNYRVAMAILGILTGLMGYLFLLKLLGPDPAFVIGGLFALNNTLLVNSTFETSDVLFAMLGLVSLISLVSLNVQGKEKYLFTIGALLSGIPALVRINGWGLPLSSGLFLFFSRKDSSSMGRVMATLTFVTVSLIVPCLWELHKSSYAPSYNEGEYISAVAGRSFTTQLSIIGNAAVSYASEISTAIAGVSIKTGILEFLIVGLIFIGFYVSWIRGERLLTCLTVVQFGGLLLSPAGSRYIILLIPGLLLFLLMGVSVFLELILKQVDKEWRAIFTLKRVIMSIFMLLCLTNLGQNLVTISEARMALENNGAESLRDKPFFVAARWLKANHNEQAIMTMNPRIIRYLTGMSTVETLRSGAPEESAWPTTRNQIADIIEKRKPGFLFLDSRDPKLKELILEAAETRNLEFKIVPEASFGDRYCLGQLVNRN